MNRRNFFGQLGTIFAVAAAPTIFIPKTGLVHWGKPLIYVPKQIKLKAVWCNELAQDLWAYHGITVEREMWALAKEEAEREIVQNYPNCKLLDIHKGQPTMNPTTFQVVTPLYAIVT